MIDGYTAQKIKAFWTIENLSSGLSPYAIQGQVDILLKLLSLRDQQIERLREAMSPILSKVNWKEIRGAKTGGRMGFYLSFDELIKIIEATESKGEL